MRFVLRQESFCLHRLPPQQPLDLRLFEGASWYSITRTGDELSVIAPEQVDPGPGDRQPGWCCLQVEGILDLSAIGVLAAISRVLAEAKVSICAISTYNTDHILVRAGEVDTAVRALTAAGHAVTNAP